MWMCICLQLEKFRRYASYDGIREIVFEGNHQIATLESGNLLFFPLLKGIMKLLQRSLGFFFNKGNQTNLLQGNQGNLLDHRMAFQISQGAQALHVLGTQHNGSRRCRNRTTSFAVSRLVCCTYGVTRHDTQGSIEISFHYSVSHSRCRRQYVFYLDNVEAFFSQDYGIAHL